jgi:integrase
VDADRRHVRRSLTADEFNRLVAAAETGQAIVGFTGAHRALLYLLASFTGLRASELASLTKESFRLNAEPATVVVQAAHSKRRRRDVLPIHPSLRERLAPVLIKLEAGEALFPGTWRDRAADLLRADLKAAGIPYQDDEGRVFDLHAIRGQFVTSLARAGVGLAQAQKLARHSTPALTANFYTHIGVAELAGEVGRLPGAAPRGGNEPPPAAGRSDNPASLPFERRIA